MKRQVRATPTGRLVHSKVVECIRNVGLGLSPLFPGIPIASCNVNGKHAVLPVPPAMAPCLSTQLRPEEYAMYRLTRTGTTPLYPGLVFTTAYHRELDRWRIAALPFLPAPGVQLELSLQDIAMHEIKVFQGPQARGWLGTSRLYPSKQFLIEKSIVGDTYFVEVQDCSAPNAICT